MPRITPIGPRFRLGILSRSELETILGATLDILEGVGVQFASEQALCVFEEHGAHVDRNRQVVRLPPDLVLEAMRRAPRSYVLSGRAAGTELILDGSASYFSTDGCGVHTLDFETGALRASRKQDVARMARVSDCLAEPATWQHGRDSVYNALLVPLAGADMVVGLGLLKASTLLMPEQIIFDDEIYHTPRLVAEGLDASTDGLALDVIADVGPRGHFLAHKHTRRHVRELWMPELTHPRPRLDAEPPPDIQSRARDRLNHILAEHRPEPLAPETQTELTAILDAAAREFGV